MLALFIGGIKSGKSKNAEEYTLNHSKEKPTYLATTEFFDNEMTQKVQHHRELRGNNFITLEEPLHLCEVTNNLKTTILVECVSMWINNMMYHGYEEEDILETILKLDKQKNNYVFVINDVSCSIVSDNPFVRKYVDINGRVSQLLASKCENVFNTISGISVKIK